MSETDDEVEYVEICFSFYLADPIGDRIEPRKDN